MNTIQEHIAGVIASEPVVVFMKGTADFPMCGFSATVVHILKRLGVSFRDIDVLQDPELREGIKVYSNWPTIPQLYIQGEFIGGSDITKELFQNGELQELLIIKGLLAPQDA